jgi:hypothetical protein
VTRWAISARQFRRRSPPATGRWNFDVDAAIRRPWLCLSYLQLSCRESEKHCTVDNLDLKQSGTVARQWGRSPVESARQRAKTRTGRCHEQSVLQAKIRATAPTRVGSVFDKFKQTPSLTTYQPPASDRRAALSKQPCAEIHTAAETYRSRRAGRYSGTVAICPPA